MSRRVTKIISYEDACERFSQKEMDQFEEYFLKLRCSDTAMGKDFFISSVLGTNLPSQVSERIFYLLGGGVARGLSKEMFFVALALFTRGKTTERLELIFWYYCFGSGSTLTRDDFIYVTSLLEGVSSGAKAGDVFRVDKMTCSDFVEWARKNENVTVLIQWAFRDLDRWSELEKRPRLIKQLEEQTNFTSAEIYELELKFVEIRNASASGMLDIDAFKELFSPPLPGSLALSLFRVFDVNKDGHCDFKEIITVLSKLRGDEEEQRLFVFSLFTDESTDEMALTRENVLELVRCVWKIEAIHEEDDDLPRLSEIKEGEVPSTCVNSTDVSLMVPQSPCFSGRKVSAPLPLPQVMKIMSSSSGKQRRNRRSATNGFVDCDPKEAIVENAFLEMGIDRNGSMSKNQFLKWARKHPFSDQILENVIQSAHISFGLKPQSKEEARDTIKECLRRDANKLRKAGDKWFVISNHWWCSWKAFVGFDDKDESSPDTTAPKPGMITNTDIVLAESPEIKLRSQWGPRLVDGIVANKDYTLVPARVWNALSYWYKTTHEIPRPVITTKSGRARSRTVSFTHLRMAPSFPTGKQCKGPQTGPFLPYHLQQCADSR